MVPKFSSFPAAHVPIDTSIGFIPTITTLSKRISKFPSYLSDYDCNSFHSPIVYHISQYMTYDQFSDSHHAFINVISNITEPENYMQASLDPKWQNAMAAELPALK